MKTARKVRPMETMSRFTMRMVPNILVAVRFDLFLFCRVNFLNGERRLLNSDCCVLNLFVVFRLRCEMARGRRGVVSMSFR